MNKDIISHIISIALSEYKKPRWQVRELIRLRFVEELEIKDGAERTGLTYNKVYHLCAEPIRKVKKVAKEYHEK